MKTWCFHCDFSSGWLTATDYLMEDAIIFVEKRLPCKYYLSLIYERIKYAIKALAGHKNCSGSSAIQAAPLTFGFHRRLTESMQATEATFQLHLSMHAHLRAGLKLLLAYSAKATHKSQISRGRGDFFPTPCNSLCWQMRAHHCYHLAFIKLFFSCLHGQGTLVSPFKPFIFMASEVYFSLAPKSPLLQHRWTLPDIRATTFNPLSSPCSPSLP